MDGAVFADVASFATIAMLGFGLWKTRKHDNKENRIEREDLIKWRTIVDVRLDALEKKK